MLFTYANFITPRRVIIRYITSRNPVIMMITGENRGTLPPLTLSFGAFAVTTLRCFSRDISSD